MQCVEQISHRSPLSATLRGSKVAATLATSTVAPPAALPTTVSANSSGAESTPAVSAMELQGCSQENTPCGKLYWWSWPEVQCCGSLRCEQLLGGSGKVCTRLQSQCVPANSICGGPGQLTQECCGNAVCQRLRGGDQMKCLERASRSCWSFNGGTCVNVHSAGPETTCYAAFTDCYQA